MRNVAKKYHKEIADKIKIALEDEIKMQDLAEEKDGCSELRQWLKV